MGSASGGRAASIAYAPVETTRLNDVDPQAWLAEVLDGIRAGPTSLSAGP